MSVAAVAVWLAFAAPMSAPAPKPPAPACCGDCKGTGMVPTGDGITRVWCSCPKSCPCADRRPKPQCRDGKSLK